MLELAKHLSTSPAHAHRHILSAAVRKMLRPLVRILLRSGIPYGLFADVAKQVYVEIADDEVAIRGRKQTVSRVSGWLRDARFVDENGEPVWLPMAGEGASFTQLVKEFSGDVPPRAILDELMNVGAVEHLDDDRVRLLTRAYIPRDSKADQLGILGTDVAYLIATIDQNVHETDAAPLFQRKVVYDNLPDDVLPRLQKLSGDQAQVLLEQLDHWMSQHDRDVNPSAGGSGRKRAGLGIYYFEEDFEEGEQS